MAVLKAAAGVGTCVIMPAADITPEFAEHSDSIVPSFAPGEVDTYRTVIEKARRVALEHSDSLMSDLPRLKEDIKSISDALIIICVPAGKDVEETVLRLAHSGAEIVHIVADRCGREINKAGETDRRVLKDIIRSVHLRLVEHGIRDEITLIASGGIAMAEHVPKAMLCGADLTAIDIPLMIALGARVHEEPEAKLVLPEGLDRIPVPVLTQRMVNLMGAWHSQILEVMGAMGIREARRLRGESGRAIFFEEVDRDTFGRLFKKNKEAVGK
jgi:glutamate synthase domain-containing protein 2